MELVFDDGEDGFSVIQENYRLCIEDEEGCLSVSRRMEKLLDDIRASEPYENAKSVYVKLLFAGIPENSAAHLGELTGKKLPKAVTAGMSLTLFGQYAEKEFITVNCCFFESSKVVLLEHDGLPTHYKTSGREFGKRIAAMEDVKGIEMFCAGMGVDVSRFVEGVTEENPEIPLFGALAGMFFDRHVIGEDRYRTIFDTEKDVSYYAIGNKLYKTGIVMVLFQGKDLNIKSDCLLGWKPLGKEMTVTESVSRTCVAKIDGIKATDVYQNYLKVLPDEMFLRNICEFPMIVERNGYLMARVPHTYDIDGRVYLNADIREGEKLRLSYANSREVLDETREASDRMWEFHPQGIFLCICGNRNVFLRDDAVREVEDYKRLQPQLVENYGSGEIYRYMGKGGVLNSAFVAVGLREGAAPAGTGTLAPEVDQTGYSNRVIPLSTRLAAFLDATTKELEESNSELREMADAAKAASTAKTQFLSNMSHEIRTPINAILGMDEMILRECKDEAVLEYAENIRMAGNNLLGLINDVLDFSKIESGKLEVIPVEYALSSVLNDLVNMIQNRASKKGLTLSVKVAQDIPSILYGDEIRIKQIVTNILTNAVKYTEKGSVTLTVDYTPKDADTILLWVGVKDTGIGIKEEDIERLFTAFERIDEKRNRAVEGTGLGMNITQRLLRLLDSKLEVKSVYGEGSVFSFMLEQKVMNWEPMGDFEDSYRRALSHHRKYREKFVAPDANVLVVDDTVMNLTVVKGLLKQTKVRIDTAESGYECLNMITRKKYDIIFLDHRMPGLDGIETLQKMKEMADNLNGDTPVISLTANAVSGAREQYMAAGFQDYLTKPINSNHLENLMVKYLPKEKLLAREESVDNPEEQEKGAQGGTVLPEWLSKVEGLDSASGVEHCGSPQAYLDALTVFAESIVPGAKEIARFYKDEDWKNYTVKVHALKSSANVIGAKELSDRAKRLEDAGNSGYIDEIRNCTDEILQLYIGYASKLEPLLKKEDGTADEEKPLIEEGELQEAYEAMRDVAESFDYDSMMFILDSMDEYRLPEGEAERFEKLRAAAKKPDWDGVRELLNV